MDLWPTIVCGQRPADPATLERCGRGRWRWAGGEKSKLPPLLTNSATGLSVANQKWGAGLIGGFFAAA